MDELDFRVGVGALHLLCKVKIQVTARSLRELLDPAQIADFMS